MHMLQGRCDFRTALFRRFRPHILSQFIPLRLSLRRTYPFQHSTARFFRAPRLAPAPRARASHPRPAPAPRARASRPRPAPAPRTRAPHPRPAPAPRARAPRPRLAPAPRTRAPRPRLRARAPRPRLAPAPRTRAPRPRLAPAPRARASHPRPAPAPAPRTHARARARTHARAPRPASRAPHITAPNFHKPPPQCLASIVKAQEAGPISPRFRKRFVLCAKKLTPAYRLKRACIAPLFSCAPDELHAFPALLMNQNAGCPCAEALRV